MGRDIIMGIFKSMLNVSIVDNKRKLQNSFFLDTNLSQRVTNLISLVSNTVYDLSRHLTKVPWPSYCMSYSNQI